MKYTHIVIRNFDGTMDDFDKVTDFVIYEDSISFTCNGWEHTYFNHGIADYCTKEVNSNNVVHI